MLDKENEIWRETVFQFKFANKPPVFLHVRRRKHEPNAARHLLLDILQQNAIDSTVDVSDNQTIVKRNPRY
jgi:hypothetical protein